jgi:hypothetical protein
MNLIIINNGDCTCPDCVAYEARHGRRWNNTTSTYEPAPADRN